MLQWTFVVYLVFIYANLYCMALLARHKNTDWRRLPTCILVKHPPTWRQCSFRSRRCFSRFRHRFNFHNRVLVQLFFCCREQLIESLSHDGQIIILPGLHESEINTRSQREATEFLHLSDYCLQSGCTSRLVPVCPCTILSGVVLRCIHVFS